MTFPVGETAALLTAVFWTATAVFFESAGKRIGSLNVNILRLAIGLVFLVVFCVFYRGMALPLDASPHTLLYLSISGVVGFFLGDFFLFKALILVGSRISMLVMTAAPVFTTVISYFALGETLTLTELAGVSITVSGIALTVLTRKDGGKMRFTHPARGLLYALLGALGQAGGLVFSKIGMQGYDPIASGQIRIAAGLIAFLLFAILFGKTGSLIQSVKNRRAVAYTTAGAFCGPFIGVSLSLVAISHTQNGIASALMSITPLLIIPPAVLFMKERPDRKEILGALVTVAGVVLLVLK